MLFIRHEASEHFVPQHSVLTVVGLGQAVMDVVITHLRLIIVGVLVGGVCVSGRGATMKAHAHREKQIDTKKG